ncbi:hypothetical protein K3495_g1405 [Podosphaera aphanis]|nr:hypothetical protein K3495_g1405 [Podosphaera aphanis]
MQLVRISVAATILSTLHQVNAQTFTNCDPLKKTCPPNPGLGTSVFTDFTKGPSDYWKPLGATTPKYDPVDGLQLSIIKSTDAPTMSMTKYIMYGHVDLVAKSGPGQGIVSSFVLLSQDLDEIDWEWLGGISNKVQSNFFGKGDVSSYDRAATHDVQNPIDVFHTYSIDWTADRIIWMIDGTTVRTLKYTDPLSKGGKIYPQTPMEVKVGNWIGCLDMSNPDNLGTCQWAGGQADLSKAPFTMSVKSLNVTDYGCGGLYSYTDNSGTWQSIKSTGACDGKGTGPGVPADLLPEAVPVLESPPSPNKPVAPNGNPASGGNSTIPNTKSSPTGNFAGTASITPGSGTPSKDVNDASGKPKHSFGILEITVIALGLGLGFCIM